MQNCYVYIHEKGLPSYLDKIPDDEHFCFDGNGVTEKAANNFCKMFNKVNTERFAYVYQEQYNIKY